MIQSNFYVAHHPSIFPKNNADLRRQKKQPYLISASSLNLRLGDFNTTVMALIVWCAQAGIGAFPGRMKECFSFGIHS